MPGLFDNAGPFLSGFGGVLGGLGRGITNAQNANTVQQTLGGQPGLGSLITSNPQAAGIAIGQRNLEQNYSDLVGNGVPRGLAGLMVTHPEMVTKLGEIQKLGPGEVPYNALAAMLGIGGAAPNSSQQQPPSSQPSGGAPPSAPGMGPMNTQGLMSPQELAPLVERRVHGDIEAANEVKAGGISGLNPLNNKNFQAMVAQRLAEMGKTGADLAKIDANFPNYKKAQADLADMSSRMGTAQIEFGRIWPQFIQAVQKWQSRYPQGATQFPSGNAFLQFIDKNAGDPSVAPLKQYTTTLRNVYGRAISTNPRGPTDSDKAHFDEGVNTHWNMGQMQELGTALSNEMSAAQQSIPIQRNVNDVDFGFGKKLDPATQQQARDAISRGADRAKVIHRLKENGIDPEGL